MYKQDGCLPVPTARSFCTENNLLLTLFAVVFTLSILLGPPAPLAAANILDFALAAVALLSGTGEVRFVVSVESSGFLLSGPNSLAETPAC